MNKGRHNNNNNNNNNPAPIFTKLGDFYVITCNRRHQTSLTSDNKWCVGSFNYRFILKMTATRQVLQTPPSRNVTQIGQNSIFTPK